MFGFIKNAISYGKQQFEDCKHLPDVNSRVCFLATSATICVCMLILTVGLFYSDKVKEVYEGGIAMLLGGHGAAAWGRFKTKASGGDGTTADSSK